MEKLEERTEQLEGNQGNTNTRHTHTIKGAVTGLLVLSLSLCVCLSLCVREDDNRSIELEQEFGIVRGSTSVVSHPHRLVLGMNSQSM